MCPEKCGQCERDFEINKKIGVTSVMPIFLGKVCCETIKKHLTTGMEIRGSGIGKLFYGQVTSGWQKLRIPSQPSHLK